MKPNTEINHFTAGFIVGIIITFVGCVLLF